ncbi:copper amine oxidase N-terminal domain-containing protein [Bacillus sp. S/N-304-OC-R1]|uniref:copper amine oxidase N-terminal domain-containing protein n=1 Tax=Bacillus sp. S/N-304-OC-R1 TaxID=2758034 RepID=UPI001C8E7245|nr:copper amine oxidase N-terminal domain-containing protein [Bacillus sp. S/N-304-OC-R1]MBY0121452.1 copper amine oxidase N-terminal domain-containing protein [Bacillus sp. S/N-304-OC-R1]
MIPRSRLAKFISIVTLSFGLSLACPLPSTKAAAPAKNNPITIKINGDKFQTKDLPFINKGTVYLPLRDIGELLGTVVFWNSSNRTVTMTYPKLTVQLTYGSMNAKINGKTVKLTAPLQNVNSRIYIPLRFLSESTGATVDWDNTSRTVSITQNGDVYIQSFGVNSTTWLNRKTGEFYFAYPFEQAPTLAGTINSDFKGSLSFEFGETDRNNFVITVLDNFGEPHIGFDAYNFLIHSNKIIDQKKASYFQRYERNKTNYYFLDPKTNLYVTNSLLTDGKIVSVYNKNGEKVKEYNLPELTGKDENFAVLGASNDYLIVRPNRTGFLTLIDFKNNSVVELYEKLLTGKDLEYAKTNDIPYRGDELRFSFASSDENELYFYYISPFDSKDEYKKLTYYRGSN